MKNLRINYLPVGTTAFAWRSQLHRNLLRAAKLLLWGGCRLRHLHAAAGGAAAGGSSRGWGQGERAAHSQSGACDDLSRQKAIQSVSDGSDSRANPVIGQCKPYLPLAIGRFGGCVNITAGLARRHAALFSLMYPNSKVWKAKKVRILLSK